MRFRELTVTAVLITVPVLAVAEDYRCTLGDKVRRIEIMYEPGLAVPCEVHYFKDTEAPGSREVLWSAQNEAGYCESQTEELVAMLRSFGWDCSAGRIEDIPDDSSDRPTPPVIE